MHVESVFFHMFIIEGLRTKVGQPKIILETMHELHKNAISTAVGC